MRGPVRQQEGLRVYSTGASVGATGMVQEKVQKPGEELVVVSLEFHAAAWVGIAYTGIKYH
jgi:hypothetical protein